MPESLLQYLNSITVTVQSQGGGQKAGQVTSDHEQITGLPTTVKAQFRLDYVRPTHCLLTASDPQLCPCFPIYLQEDVTKVNPLQHLAQNANTTGSKRTNMKYSRYLHLRTSNIFSSDHLL